MEHLDQLIITGCAVVEDTISEYLGLSAELAIEEKCLGAHAFAK